MFGIGTEVDNKSRIHLVIRPAIGIKAFQIYDIEQQPIKINSVITNKSSGGITGVQIKPDRRTTNTDSLTGLEVSPRVNDAGSGDMVSVKADVVLKTASSARTVNNIVNFEANIDFPGGGSAYTITNDINAFSTFLDVGAGHTITGKKAVLKVRTPNTAGWDFLFDLETSAGVMRGAGASNAVDSIKIQVAGATRYILVYDT